VAEDGLEVDEWALTGEPMDIDKNKTDDPFMLSGCQATAGNGSFIATAVGKDSQWGVIKLHLEREQEQTPLREKLDDMARWYGSCRHDVCCHDPSYHQDSNRSERIGANMLDNDHKVT
jgi:magnesium-transporting ATPase (P-type)